MHFPRLFLVFLVVSFLLLLAACTTSPATNDNSFTIFLSPEQERQIGAQQHPRLVEDMGGVYPDPELQAYVAEVGAKLVRVSGTPDLPYTFTIIDTQDVNAFALPGGYVHVTRGLLALANSEAELAGVLAHEIAHVVARHSAERYSRSITVGLGAAVLGAIAEAAGLPAGVDDLAVLGSEAYLQSYSRDQELEADMLGIRYLMQAGYEPRAMANFLASLDAYSRLQAALAGRPTAADVMASHPRTTDRMARALQLAGRAPLTDAEAGKAAYLARIDGLIYGDSPAQGLRIGCDFYHQDLRIAFRVPPGFVMINRPRSVIALGPEGSLIAFDMARAPNMADPVTYVGQDWEGLKLTHLERIEIDGMEGATGAARVQTRAGMADVRLVAVRADPTRLYRFIVFMPSRLAGQLAAEVKRTVYSFRRLTQAEAAAVEPLRIRVVTVKPSDTARSLAAGMPFADFRLEHFLVLNQIDPNTQLKPGQKVKIVARDGSR